MGEIEKLRFQCLPCFKVEENAKKKSPFFLFFYARVSPTTLITTKPKQKEEIVEIVDNWHVCGRKQWLRSHKLFQSLSDIG